MGTQGWVPVLEHNKAFMTAPLGSKWLSWPAASFIQLGFGQLHACPFQFTLHMKGQSEKMQTPSQTLSPYMVYPTPPQSLPPLQPQWPTKCSKTGLCLAFRSQLRSSGLISSERPFQPFCLKVISSCGSITVYFLQSIYHE